MNDNTNTNTPSKRAKSFDLTESQIIELANMASEHIYFGVMDEALLSSAGVLAILKRYEEMKDNADADTWFLPSERLPEDGSRVWVEYPNGVQSSYVWFRSVFFTTSYGMIIQNVQRWKPYE